MPKGIMEKAIEHARMRMEMGKPAFATEEDKPVGMP